MEMGGAAYGVRSHKQQTVERQTPYGAGFVAQHVRNAQGAILSGQVDVDIENRPGVLFRPRAVKDSRPMGSPRTSRANVLNPSVAGRPGSGAFATGLTENLGAPGPLNMPAYVSSGSNASSAETTGEQSEPLRDNKAVQGY